MTICQERFCPAASRAEADIIIVLGAQIRGDGQPGPAIERRMDVALALYRTGEAPRLLLSGGGTGAIPEAEIMRRMAQATGVPESDLLLETRSASTVENAIECARMLAADPPAAVLLVTDSPHAVRARILFRMAGLPVRRVATAPVGLTTMIPMVVTETIKLPISVVRMMGRKNAPGMSRF